MFHILIVEDVLNTLQELCELLHEVFPDLTIESADNVAIGLALIRQAADREQFFDIAILDFRLPPARGENDEIDESLCREIKQQMPDTLVIHITSFHKEQRVIDHIARFHSRKNTPRAELIPKKASWTEKLLAEVKAHLYGQLIEDQLATIFAPSGIDGITRGAGMQAQGSLTHKLAALSRDIANYWRDLSENTRAKIQKYYIVNEMPEDTRVRLRSNLAE